MTSALKIISDVQEVEQLIVPVDPKPETDASKPNKGDSANVGRNTVCDCSKWMWHSTIAT